MFIQNANLRKRLGLGRLLEADGGAGGTGAGGDNSTGTGEGAEGNDSGAGDNSEGELGSEGDKTFDDILKDKKYQSEFDKRIAKALETAKSKWEVDYNQKLEDAKTEAEKLAAMTANEKAKYEAQKAKEAEEKRVAELNDDLAKREREITIRELKAQAYETLAEKGIPKELVDILNYESADTCNKSIESVQKAFQTAVEKAVNERLRGNGAPKGGQGKENTLEAQIAKAVRGQI
ncbi:hypothetical protein LF65_02276 [Clostridium beijerinckii]|uniref:DUF4355 domain-containing protein n=1 Tax=Clostridium beijerinckii TaxID=1520 RepID=A0A0B5QLJ3_CLOBE|nr:DUF4355 domain-containing protein [Clostridium beijerinckii]AJG98862.1 hypothetical protein LF65_02276 [Clostridium beijerinckii]